MHGLRFDVLAVLCETIVFDVPVIVGKAPCSLYVQVLKTLIFSILSE
jgi:hypothetical protein